MPDIAQPLRHLAQEDWSVIEALNDRIQAHQGSWGHIEGGQEVEPGMRQMPFAVPDPLINEFVHTWYQLNLVIEFDWPEWEQGRQWLANSDPAKYDTLDSQTALQLLTALIRSDRYVEGTLLEAFESQKIPKIMNGLAILRTP